MNYYYKCVECGKEIETEEIIYTCPDCRKKQNPGGETRGVLKICYKDIDKDALRKKLHSDSKRSFFKYDMIMPVNNAMHVSKLDVGNASIYEYGDKGLYIFDDTRNPSLSYKDRASLLVAAKALDFRKPSIIAASTGNAASSLAAICASYANLRCILCVPEKAPQGKLLQMLMFGAEVIRVKGNYDAAFELSLELTEKYGIYNRNTAYNPFTIEGKKSAALEIYDYFNGRIPERFFVPVGDGCIISGIYKGFEDLIGLGLLEKMPIVVSAQAEKSNVINEAVRNNGEIKNLDDAPTLADSISVAAPRNSRMAVKYLKTYNGEVMDISDKDILKAMRILSGTTGVFAEPAASCAYAAFLEYRKNSGTDRSIVVLTGNGLKDTAGAMRCIDMPEPLQPDIDNPVLLKKLGL